MKYDNLREQRIEDLLNRVEGLAAVAAQAEVQSVMAVVARCTIEIGGSLAQVSGDIQQAQTILGARLAEFTEQLRQTRSEMSRSSDVASRYTGALVRWTKVLGFVTAAYTLLTGGLLLVAAFGSPWSQRPSISATKAPAIPSPATSPTDDGKPQ